MAQTIHPLFRTRGVPGTHDIPLGHATLDALTAGRPAKIPRFDKSTDDHAPQTAWPTAGPDTQLIILEGWCLGARPQSEQDLATPVNALEREQDPRLIWRRHANHALADHYQPLFARIDLLILLAAPNFEIVQTWRTEQEHALRHRTNAGMTDEQVAAFIQHYERLTHHILAEMPARAHITAWLNPDRSLNRLQAVPAVTQPPPSA